VDFEVVGAVMEFFLHWFEGSPLMFIMFIVGLAMMGYGGVGLIRAWLAWRHFMEVRVRIKEKDPGRERWR